MKKVVLLMFSGALGLQAVSAAAGPTVNPGQPEGTHSSPSPPAQQTLPEGQENGDGTVSFRHDILPIFRNCIMCHQDALPIGGLSLTPESAYQQLVGFRAIEADRDRVDAGSPEKSYLLDKVTGRNASVKGGGVGMPMGQAPLRQDDVDLIRRWIKQGAKNN